MSRRMALGTNEQEPVGAGDGERAQSRPCALCGDPADEWLEWAFRACARCHEELGPRLQAVIDDYRQQRERAFPHWARGEERRPLRDEDEALRWTHRPPRSSGYYWLSCAGYARGIIVWVYIGSEGQLVTDAPIRRNVADVDGFWAGPLSSPAGQPTQD